MVEGLCLLRHRSKGGDLHGLIGFDIPDFPMALNVCVCVFHLYFFPSFSLSHVSVLDCDRLEFNLILAWKHVYVEMEECSIIKTM